MKFKWIIFIITLVFYLNGCLNTSTQTRNNIHSQITDTKILYEKMYCKTKNEEAMKLYNNGFFLTKSGNIEEAIKSYRKAIEIDENYCDAMDNLGLLLRKQNKIDEAILWYKKSIEIFPKNSVSHNNLAVAYSIKGSFNEAISEFKVMINIDPNNPEGYYGLGGAYQSINEHKKAIDNLKTAEQLYTKESSPLVSDARYRLGISFFRIKDYPMSINYIKQVYPEHANEPLANYILGTSYLISNDLTEGKKYLTKAQELGMKIPEDLAKKLNM